MIEYLISLLLFTCLIAATVSVVGVAALVAIWLSDLVKTWLP